MLVGSPVLAYPDPNGSFFLDTDASGVGIGAVLSQEHSGVEKVIGYFSRTLNKSDRRYCVTRRELLAVIEALKHFHPYLYGVPFTIRSDHGSLRWLLNFKNIEGQLGRWSECLGSYNFKLIHRVGRVHGNADVLSRRPCTTCKYCDRIEVREFKENMDECKCRTVTTPVGNTSTWIEGKTSCDIAKEQDEDVNLSVVKGWIQASDQRPRWKEISHLNEKLKGFWSQLDRLVVKNSILYCK